MVALSRWGKKDEQAVRFYQHFDFLPFQQTPRRLFLPMATIAKLF
jgi:hypothetical protein